MRDARGAEGGEEDELRKRRGGAPTRAMTPVGKRAGGFARRDGFALTRHADVIVVRFGSTHYHADSFERLGDVLNEARRAASSDGAAALVVADLGGVVLLSSTALGALRTAHRAIEEGGGRLVAAAGGDLVAGVLKFAPFIAHHPTVGEAVAALSKAAGEAFEKEQDR